MVEDQVTFCELLAELLHAANFDVDTAATGGDARAKLANATFELLLLDLMLPDLHGFDLLAELPRATRVLVLTAQARPQVVREATERGVHGVVTKGAPLRELREAIDRVSSGGVYYASESSRLLREASVEPKRDEPLTARQREILRAVASGLSSKEIAQRLHLSEKTVSNHRARIMERLGVHDVASLTRYAVANGLIGTDG